MKTSVIFATLLALITLTACNPITYDVFATLSGTVVDADTMEPIDGVSVLLSPSGKNKLTGSDGHFEFANLDAIQYTITVQKSGYCTNRKLVNAIAGETTATTITMEVKK